MRRQDFLEQATGTVPALPRTVQDWNALALRALRGARVPVTPAARTLAILHTAMYNAWAAYDGLARQTRHGVAVRLPPSERHGAAQAVAMRHAAHRVLAERLPAQRAVFDAHLADRMRMALGDRADHRDQSDPRHDLTPAGIGRIQAASLLDACGQDGAHRGLASARALARRDDDMERLCERWCALAREVSERGAYDEDGDVLMFLMLANALDAALMATLMATRTVTPELTRMQSLLLIDAAWPPGLENTPRRAACDAAADEVLRRLSAGAGEKDERTAAPASAPEPVLPLARLLGARVVERALACRRGQSR